MLEEQTVAPAIQEEAVEELRDGESQDEVIIDDSERTCDLDNLLCPDDIVWKKHEGSCLCHCIIECPDLQIRDNN